VPARATASKQDEAQLAAVLQQVTFTPAAAGTASAAAAATAPAAAAAAAAPAAAPAAGKDAPAKDAPAKGAPAAGGRDAPKGPGLPGLPGGLGGLKLDPAQIAEILRKGTEDTQQLLKQAGEAACGAFAAAAEMHKRYAPRRARPLTVCPDLRARIARSREAAAAGALRAKEARAGMKAATTEIGATVVSVVKKEGGGEQGGGAAAPGGGAAAASLGKEVLKVRAGSAPGGAAGRGRTSRARAARVQPRSSRRARPCARRASAAPLPPGRDDHPAEPHRRVWHGVGRPARRRGRGGGVLNGLRGQGGGHREHGPGGGARLAQVRAGGAAGRPGPQRG
jgi:hypothetical protein